MNGQLISCIRFIIDGFVFQKYGFVFRNLVVKFMVWRGKAVDVWSKSTYPANVLSNLYNNGFAGGIVAIFLVSIEISYSTSSFIPQT